MASTSETEEESSKFKQTTTKFATDLYLAVKSTQNIVMSPIGLQILLAMMQQGAQGQTANEIANVLYQSQNDKEILECYKEMIRGFQNEFLKFAARIFVEETFLISPDFLKISKHYFISDASQIHFKTNPDESRKYINDWAARITNNKIKDFLSEGSVTAQTNLILANVIYFKANWKMKFDKSRTSDQPFYLTQDSSVNVKMMLLDESDLEYSECEKLNAQIVALPYDNDEFRMVIILPRNRNGLLDVESKLTSVNLIDEVSALEKLKVTLVMPKFKIEHTIMFKDVLTKMGMTTALGKKADFSGVSSQPLEISNIIQKAFIEINEEGTEAAAVSAGIMFLSASYSVQFKCDHPFLYMILHNAEILFLGRFCDPRNC